MVIHNYPVVTDIWNFLANILNLIVYKLRAILDYLVNGCCLEGFHKLEGWIQLRNHTSMVK